MPHSTTRHLLTHDQRSYLKHILALKNFGPPRFKILEDQPSYQDLMRPVEYLARSVRRGRIVVRIPLKEKCTFKVWLENKAAIDARIVMQRHRVLQTLDAPSRFLGHVARMIFIGNNPIECTECDRLVPLVGNLRYGYKYRCCGLDYPLSHGMSDEMLAGARPDRTRRAAHRRRRTAKGLPSA